MRESFWRQGMMAGFPSYFCIKAFSETDLTADLEKIDDPTLILQVYPSAPHGMCTTNRGEIT